MAKSVLVQLVNKNGLVISNYVANAGVNPTVAVKSAFSEAHWIVEIGDTIHIKEIDMDSLKAEMRETAKRWEDSEM